MNVFILRFIMELCNVSLIKKSGLENKLQPK